MSKNVLFKYFRSRLIQDVLFWAVSFFILLNIFTRTNQIRPIDYIYTFLFHIPLFVAVSGNSYLLIPKFLSNGKYGLYIIFHLPLYGITYLSYYFTFNTLAAWVFPEYYFVANLSYADFLIFYLVFIGLTTLIELSKSWFQKLEIEKEMEALKKEKVETELRVLREQINPHFLFNSLNHIYSLAMQKSSDTPEAVLQLSELLRYTLNQTENDTAPLEDEINYISKYINLYKNRISHPERVEFITEGNFENWTISPLLLIFFIENCFKHGTVDQPGESIHIRIVNKNGNLMLRTSNSVDGDSDFPREKEQLGLENVRRRLELLYPDRHQLDITAKNHTFNVKLLMELE